MNPAFKAQIENLNSLVIDFNLQNLTAKPWQLMNPLKAIIGVSLQVFTTYENEQTDIWKDDKKFNIVFAGNIGESQDFPTILAAAEQLKQHEHIRWLIVGDGRKAAWVVDEINKRNLKDQFILLGRHPLERMPSFFKHADALLVSLKDTPIFSMTIPGKLQTYLATGIPIIAMLNGEGAEIIRTAQAGMTCPAGDHQKLATTLLEMSQTSLAERQRMGENGRLLNDTTFNRERLISQLEEWLTTTQYTKRTA